MALALEEDIGWLDVSVDPTVRVHVLHSIHQLRRVGNNHSWRNPVPRLFVQRHFTVLKHKEKGTKIVFNRIRVLLKNALEYGASLDRAYIILPVVENDVFMMEQFVRKNFYVEIVSEFLDGFIVLLDFLDDNLIAVVTTSSQVNLSKCTL